ncbi:MAG: hypothetical protein A2049_01870 [Elusimicrobia bacterium GWA2_62_23]|nr:MAG: hypothetical protein A2049_01870 [Elusimicrobia bacterium GWA2_62_23]HBB66625.1 hypothetical protein [Elusimicrobiota bacterium]
MADFSAITAWAAANSARHEISLTKLSWINEWLPGFFDYRAKIRVGASVYFGRGIDAEENIACDKALAEALERAAVAEMASPWAAAAYPEFDGAAERAYRELLSIDRVLCHHYSKTPFKTLALDVLEKPVSRTAVAKALGARGLHLQLCELRPATDATIAAAFIWSERAHPVKGIVCGYGCEKTLPAAAAHALIECLRTAAAVFCGEITPEPWETRCTPGNPRYHFWMAQKEAAKIFLTATLLPSGARGNSPWQPENISRTAASYKEIPGPMSLIPELPVKIVQAASAKLLKPQFGEIFMDAQFLQRLERFSGKKVIPETDPPHFYD